MRKLPFAAVALAGLLWASPAKACDGFGFGGGFMQSDFAFAPTIAFMPTVSFQPVFFDSPSLFVGGGGRGRSFESFSFQSRSRFGGFNRGFERTNVRFRSTTIRR